MTSRVFQVLEVEPLQQGESIIDMSSDNAENQSNYSYLQMTQLPQIFLPCIPSEKFNTIKSK